MTPNNLSQLERALLGLRSLILSGTFAQGQRLSEVKVAEQLGISRTPLRQAIERLVSEGLLERIPTGGSRIAPITYRDIADAIELRGVVEGTAARMAAERGVAPELLDQANATLDRIDLAIADPVRPNFDQYVQLNARFHDLLAEFPASPLIQREVTRMSQLPLASPSAFLSDQALIPGFLESMQYAQRQHRGILEAVKNREGTRAEALSREHARLALANLEYLNKEDPKLQKAVLSLVSTAVV